MSGPTWESNETVLGLVKQSVFFTKTLVASDTVNYSIVSGSLPDGVVLNSATGVLSGTPDVTDPTPNTPIFVFTFTVRATGSNSEYTDKIIKLPVLYGDLFVPSVLDQGKVKYINNNFQYQVVQGTVNTGTNTYWRIKHGVLPSGTVLFQNGTISGTLTNSAIPMIRQTFLKPDAPKLPQLSQEAWDEWFTTFLYTSQFEKDYQIVVELSDNQGPIQYSFTVRLVFAKVPMTPDSWFYQNSQYLNFDTGIYYSFISASDSDVITWETNQVLEAVYNGSISDKSIVAKINNDKLINYSLKPNYYNRLPNGVAFNTNGLITGKISFRCYQDDPETVPVNDDYEFTIRAQTEDGFTYAEKTFDWHIIRFHDKPYDNIWIRAFPTANERKRLEKLLNSRVLFPLNSIYRYSDPWFGKSQELRFLFVPGLENSPTSDYMAALQENHYKKTLLFGKVQTATCLDSDLQVKYEVVYVPIVDHLSKLDPVTGRLVGLPNVIDLRTQIKNYYWDKDGQVKYIFKPNGLVNMRRRLEESVGFYNEGVLPGWMTSLQPIPEKLGQFYSPLGYIPAVVLCYTVPGGSNLIAFRLRQLGINFNDFRFEFDRYELEQGSTNTNGYVAATGTQFDNDTTLFDEDSTMFNDNLEYVGSGPFANNKYLKFPKTGAFS
jgi:hypothetical protein